MSKKGRGFVVYEGSSLMDGASIVGVVTIGSGNSKTGNVATLWVLPAEVDSLTAVKTGQDATVCGSCPHRGVLRDALGIKQPSDRTGYVLVHQASLGIWRAWKRGS